MLEDVQVIQKTTYKSCKQLWNSFDDLLEEFGMQPMTPLIKQHLPKS